jgi:hypothetical protein
MGIQLTSAGYYDLKLHVGHKIVVVGYGRDEDEDFANVALECEDCGEVLVDFDQPFFFTNAKGEYECSNCGCEIYQDEGEMYCSHEQCKNAKKDWGSIGEPS